MEPRPKISAAERFDSGFVRREPAWVAPREISVAQLDQGYGHLPISLVVNLANGLVLTAVLWDAVERITLLVWLLLLATVSAGRYAALRAFRDARHGTQLDLETWRGSFLIGACAAGAVWGAAGVLLFHPDAFTHQVFLAFVLGGMVAGAIPLLSAVDYAYALFAVPVVLPISLQMLTLGDRVHVTMGLLILIFGVAMLASSVQVGRLFREANELRHKLSFSVAASETLQALLRRDELTGIANRRLFEEELDREWRRAKREGDPLAIVTADIDQFKDYNDHYGHPAGDRCLTEVARTMESALSRPGDVAARIGGEEFAFLLPGTTLEGARAVAELIRARVLDLELPHEASSMAGKVTISLGVASSERSSIESAADLLRASDAALYAAKRRGRNQVVAFEG